MLPQNLSYNGWQHGVTKQPKATFSVYSRYQLFQLIMIGNIKSLIALSYNFGKQIVNQSVVAETI